ncbi:MAG: hypothetical protein LH615_16250, partial [Ferruginibacter sp.]|nr:hypothetical protein [Ferruginibacter sp.]
MKKHKVPVTLFVSPEVIIAQKNYWFQEIKGYDEGLLKNILANQLNILYASISRFTVMQIFKCLVADTIKDVITQYQQQTDCGTKACENLSVEQLKEMDSSGLV